MALRSSRGLGQGWQTARGQARGLHSGMIPVPGLEGLACQVTKRRSIQTAELRSTTATTEHPLPLPDCHTAGQPHLWRREEDRRGSFWKLCFREHSSLRQADSLHLPGTFWLVSDLCSRSVRRYPGEICLAAGTPKLACRPCGHFCGHRMLNLLLSWTAA